MVLWKELGVVLFSIPCKQFLHDFHSLCFALLMSVFCLLSLLFLSPSLASRPLSFSVIFTPVDPHSFWHEAVKWDISQCDSQPAWQTALHSSCSGLIPRVPASGLQEQLECVLWAGWAYAHPCHQQPPFHVFLSTVLCICNKWWKEENPFCVKCWAQEKELIRFAISKKGLPKGPGQKMNPRMISPISALLKRMHSYCLASAYDLLPAPADFLKWRIRAADSCALHRSCQTAAQPVRLPCGFGPNKTSMTHIMRY